MAFPATSRRCSTPTRCSAKPHRSASTGTTSTARCPKVDEELDELREAIATAVEGDIEAELGDLLFAVVNVARHLDVDPETALRGASAKFRSRFQAVEAQAEASGRDLSTMTLAELDALWDQAKR